MLAASPAVTTAPPSADHLGGSGGEPQDPAAEVPSVLTVILSS